MLSGRGGCFVFILPLGMLCFSAWIMMFVRVLFATCMSVGSALFSSAVPISVVLEAQSALW
jgi:hypothetical protein